MKVKIEDFLLAMGEYCKEHDVEECLQGKCGLSVDHDDPGNGDEYNKTTHLSGKTTICLNGIAEKCKN